jgi:hypothetical protein
MHGAHCPPPTDSPTLPPPHPPTPSQYPEVLGSILGGLKAIVNVIGMTRMTPPIKELLPRLTPILKNRHEKVRGESSGWLTVCLPCLWLCSICYRSKRCFTIPTKSTNQTNHRSTNRPPPSSCTPQVQENCIDLVGRIADRGAEYVPAREWMRICFELLDMLKAHKKAIRRATVNTFGYIAKAIGPQVGGWAGGGVGGLGEAVWA